TMGKNTRREFITKSTAAVAGVSVGLIKEVLVSISFFMSSF
ncbi:MAG: twin-arginine translocation signal domain-containing protein, partial [Draconibacterium sp.]|nr:twin-arginine translocation signal domain-containing protein [Draconibacterium sp.]